jgi:hypothetical protein
MKGKVFISDQYKEGNMGGIMRSMKCSVLIFVILLTLACSSGGGDPAPAPPPAFTTADLEGYSYIIGVSTGGTNEGNMAGHVILNSAGNVTSGAYAHSSNSSLVNLTGGSLALDGKGLLSGSINADTGVVVSIQYGKLNAAKNFASFVNSTNYGELDLVAVIKTGGSFVLSDLGGIWHISESVVGGTNENVYYGPVTVSNTGVIASSRFNGNFSLDSNGVITGDGTSTTNSMSFVGAIDTSKQIAVYNTFYSTGEVSFSIALRESGSFSVSDLSGNWHFTLASTGNSDGTSYGMIQLDSAGQVRGGFYRSTGGNVNLSGGSVSINTSGILSGNINASDGTTFSVVYGKMNYSKNVISVSGSSSSTGGAILLIANKES